MEYQVPQFIEVEDKIVGPLTLKQFIYIAGASGLCIIFFAYMPTIVALLLSAPVVALAVSLAFYKMNGKPFIEVIENGFNYYVGAKLFLWKHDESKTIDRIVEATPTTTREARGTPRLTRGKLSELAWSLDVKSAGDNSAGFES